MEKSDSNPDFRNNPEKFHPWEWDVGTVKPV